MFKFTAVLAGLLIMFMLIMPFVSAVQVSDIQQGVEENNAQISQLKADTTAKLSEISNKLDKYSTKEDISKMLQAHLELTNKIMESYRSSMTITWIMTCLATLGGFFSIYFYFKSKRRI